MEAKDKANLFRGIKALYKGAKGRFSFFEDLSKIHYHYHNYLHFVPLFLPWHRYFLVYLEQALQTATNSDVTVPYWDWTLDRNAIEKAPVWDKNAFGSNGREEDGCLADGVLAFQRSRFPTDHCIRRRWTFHETDGPFIVISRERINQILVKSDSYEMFRHTLEMAPHGNIHSLIGGDMMSFYSPNDPIFFLHHAFMDKLWWNFQNKDKKKFMFAYEGPQTDFMKLETGPFDEFRSPPRPASLNDPLLPFKGWRVKDTFDTTKLCYTYLELPVVMYPKHFSAAPSNSTASSATVVRNGAEGKVNLVVNAPVMELTVGSK